MLWDLPTNFTHLSASAIRNNIQAELSNYRLVS